MSIANDSETNNSVCQAMLASFAKAYVTLSEKNGFISRTVCQK